jgi:RNA polymerase sigma factor (sigma-70 family)
VGDFVDYWGEDPDGASEAYVNQYYEPVKKLCATRCKSSNIVREAEDLTHVVIIEGLRRLTSTSLRNRSLRIMALLAIICRHRKTDVVRSATTRLIVSFDEVALDEAIAGLTDNLVDNRAIEEIAIALWECIDELPSDRAQLVIAVYFMDWSLSALGKKQGCSRQVIHVKVKHSLRELRDCLEGKGWTKECLPTL